MAPRLRRPSLADTGLVVLALVTVVLAVFAVRGSRGTPAEPSAALGPLPTAGATPASSQAKRLPALLRAADGDVTAVWLGDALASGRGASSDTRGYKPLMRERLKGDGPLQEVGADVDGTLAGVGNVPSGLSLAVVELGTQDVAGTGVQDFRTQYASVLQEVRAGSPDAVLLCAGLWKPATLSTAYDDAVRAACSAAGGTFVPLSDLYDRSDTRGPAGRATYAGDGGDPDAATTVPGDDVLPNDTGHAAIAARMLDALGV